MCISPITIPNPYCSSNSGITVGSSNIKHKFKTDKYHDTISHYIQVPCGSCLQCISMRQAWYNQRVQMESLRSEIFYFTLTYKQSALVSTDVLDYQIPYPYFKDIQNAFKRIRKVLPHPIRTMVVSEYGTDSFRPHYHGLLAVERDDINKYYLGNWRNCEAYFYDLLLHEWRRNVGSHKKPDYRKLCDLVVTRRGRTYDFHRIEPIRNHDNDVTFYVTKYILKYDERVRKLLQKISIDPRLTDTQTSDLISMIKPRCTMSKDFGSYQCDKVADYIMMCLSKNDEIPQYYDLYTGQTSLLSPYYRKHLMPPDYVFNRFQEYQERLRKKFDPSELDYDTYSLWLLDDHQMIDSPSEVQKAFQYNEKLKKVRNACSSKYSF